MNSTSDDNDNQVSENLALYCLNALPPAEMEEVPRAILAGTIDQVVAEGSLETVTALFEQLAAPMPSPRRAVKDAIMSAIAPRREAFVDGSGNHIFIYKKDDSWRDLMPGIRIKILHTDEQRGWMTFLVRLEPGSHYPAHRHLGVEECYVIEGDLHLNGVLLGAGDYTAALSDSVHFETHTEHGCLALICAPAMDEKLGN